MITSQQNLLEAETQPDIHEYLVPLKHFLDEEELADLVEHLDTEFGLENAICVSETPKGITFTKDNRTFIITETVDADRTHTGYYLELVYSENSTYRCSFHPDGEIKLIEDGIEPVEQSYADGRPKSTARVLRVINSEGMSIVIPRQPQFEQIAISADFYRHSPESPDEALMLFADNYPSMDL